MKQVGVLDDLARRTERQHRPEPAVAKSPAVCFERREVEREGARGVQRVRQLDCPGRAPSRPAATARRCRIGGGDRERSFQVLEARLWNDVRDGAAERGGWNRLRANNPINERQRIERRDVLAPDCHRPGGRT